MVGDGDEVPNLTGLVGLPQERDLAIKIAIDGGGDDFGVVRSLFHVKFLSARYPVPG